MVQNRTASTVQRRLARELMAEGRNDGEIAQTIGVSRGTIIRWRQQPEFAAKLAKVQEERCDAAQSRMLALQGAAIEVWSRTMDDEEAPLALRCDVAGKLIDRSLALGQTRKEAKSSAQPSGPVDEATLRAQLAALKASRPHLFEGLNAATPDSGKGKEADESSAIT